MTYSKKYQQGQGNLGRDAELAFFKENTVALPIGRISPVNIVGPRTPSLEIEEPGDIITRVNPVNSPELKKA